ncbi:hypothetical protein GCM10027456_42690 [Kineosporia babensis]
MLSLACAVFVMQMARTPEPARTGTARPFTPAPDLVTPEGQVLALVLDQVSPGVPVYCAGEQVCRVLAPSLAGIVVLEPGAVAGTVRQAPAASIVVLPSGSREDAALTRTIGRADWQVVGSPGRAGYSVYRVYRHA